MDVSQLLYSHQLAKLNAHHALSHQNPESHFDFVRHYAKRIMARRKAEGLSGSGWPSPERAYKPAGI